MVRSSTPNFTQSDDWKNQPHFQIRHSAMAQIIGAAKNLNMLAQLQIFTYTGLPKLFKN